MRGSKRVKVGQRVKSLTKEEHGEAVDPPLEDCYGLSDYNCYTIAQSLTSNKRGKVKVLASW